MRNRLNGSNIFDSSERRAFVWISLVFVLFRGVLCKRINENQTTKSHKPEITKTHEGSVDESSMSVQALKALNVKAWANGPGLSAADSSSATFATVSVRRFEK